ncbi:ABC transporter permease [Halocatena halophila]|uniref:ABC transporter permease n=1 Tax=Halocatena halophila TaxID=2814576 RepID=UPI002ED5B124
MSRSEGSSPFTTVSDVELNDRERIARWLEQSVFAPARVLLSDWRGIVGALIVFAYILAGTVGVWLIPEPVQNQAPREAVWFQSMEYILGADHMGRSLVSLIVHGTPTILKMILAGAVFTTVMATTVGMLSGYKGGRVDTILSTVMDVFITIPGLPLVIVLATMFEPKNVYLIGILVTINTWAGLARSIRSQVLTIRGEYYVEVSRTMGVPIRTILKDDILPNILPYVFINFVLAGRRVIFSSVALYFLGILPRVGSHWGVILNTAYSNGALYTSSLRYWIIVPVATIVVLSYGLFILSQAADRLFNVRLRAKHESTSEETTGMPAD